MAASRVGAAITRTMALVVETGSGNNPAANSYALVADGDAYHAAHLYATAWTGADNPTKEKALMMATMVLDQTMAWHGYLSNSEQPLQWPRNRVINRNRYSYAYGYGSQSQWYDPTKIPKDIRDATCELARTLLEGDRTKDVAWKGIQSMNIAGEIQFTFDKLDRTRVFTDQLVQMLQPFGRPRYKGGGRRVVRGQ